MRWSGGVLALAVGLLAASLSVMSTRAALPASRVNVLYAGSLVNQMERGVGPAFGKATGDEFKGYAGASGGAVAGPGLVIQSVSMNADDQWRMSIS